MLNKDKNINFSEDLLDSIKEAKKDRKNNKQHSFENTDEALRSLDKQ